MNQLLAEGGPSATRTLANLESATADLQGITSRLDKWMTQYYGDVRTFSEDGLRKYSAVRCAPNHGLVVGSRYAHRALMD